MATSLRSRLLDALREGPATSRELALEVCTDTSPEVVAKVAATLGQLRSAGRVRVDGQMDVERYTPEGKRVYGGSSANLWALEGTDGDS